MCECVCVCALVCVCVCVCERERGACVCVCVCVCVLVHSTSIGTGTTSILSMSGLRIHFASACEVKGQGSGCWLSSLGSSLGVFSGLRIRDPLLHLLVLLSLNHRSKP